MRLMEIEEDYFLLLEANKRLEDNGTKTVLSMEAVMKDLEISEDELSDMGTKRREKPWPGNITAS